MGRKKRKKISSARKRRMQDSDRLLSKWGTQAKEEAKLDEHEKAYGRKGILRRT
jgi:hypothetical protein